MMLSRARFASLFVVLPMLLLSIGVARADDSQDAQKFVETQAQATLAVASDKSMSRDQQIQKYTQIFQNSFDMDAIGKYVLARHWQEATPEQQQQFQQLFIQFNVLTWAKRFQTYSGQTVKITGAQSRPNNGWEVESQIPQNQGQPVQVQWRLSHGDKGWRVTDVIIAGTSMALTQQQDFGSALQQSGNKIDGLLSALKTKIGQLQSAG